MRPSVREAGLLMKTEASGWSRLVPLAMARDRMWDPVATPLVAPLMAERLRFPIVILGALPVRALRADQRASATAAGRPHQPPTPWDQDYIIASRRLSSRTSRCPRGASVPVPEDRGLGQEHMFTDRVVRFTW